MNSTDAPDSAAKPSKAPPKTSAKRPDRSEACPRCEKALDLCVCQGIMPANSKLHVLILQHPQEPDKDLGSARLAQLALANSTLKIGLSWPNLAKALGHESTPSRWATLYLGSGIRDMVVAGPPPTNAPKARGPGLHLVDKNGEALTAVDAKKARTDLEGIIVLDGTWSQAKTLWWRNAWLLKTRRAILIPKSKSMYGNLRKEPRAECLSTIETIAESLEALGEPVELGGQLRGIFGALLGKFKVRTGGGARKDWRRR